ncbi:Uncharacterised protein [Mycobacteroides abscessus subsp. abscessus]|nr:Uncharacterised protein [Mycobacteroides abscessus subsp. abscessus]
MASPVGTNAVTGGSRLMVVCVRWAACDIPQVATPGSCEVGAHRAAHVDVDGGCNGNMPDHEKTLLRRL